MVDAKAIKNEEILLFSINMTLIIKKKFKPNNNNEL